MVAYFTLQFFRVEEMTVSQVTMFVNMPFNNENRILIKICICLQNTLQRSYCKNFQVWVATSEVFTGS